MIEFTKEELTLLSVARDEDVDYLAQCDVDIYVVFNLIAKLIKQFDELQRAVIEYQEEVEQ